MSKVCEITGKKAMVGNNVSFSINKTKRRFDVNLSKKRFYIPRGRPLGNFKSFYESFEAYQ
ncbi:50S ribosomal protein L28 [Maribacter litopenaei]|uniref:Large ribosomal subunit protein bL28 n=1 Tax=Maribacter litopenaei TaxID=2976127 RepID=A0ABY5Y4S6_9FLAO|nr:50S ribosomal protein L28 [Maribacter litopenaei]UWX54026.1 50S ribosomal protein L28 [Maribacter litopenaei]